MRTGRIWADPAIASQIPKTTAAVATKSSTRSAV